MNASIKYDDTLTVDQLVAYGDSLFAQIKKLKINLDDEADIERNEDMLRQRHDKFIYSYPIVFKYMLHCRKYSSKAFRAHILKLSKSMNRSSDEYLECQTDYATRLFMGNEKNPIKIKKFREETFKCLKDEATYMENLAKTYNEKYESDMKHDEVVIKSELQSYLRRADERLSAIADFNQGADVVPVLKMDESNFSIDNLPLDYFISADDILN